MLHFLHLFRSDNQSKAIVIQNARLVASGRFREHKVGTLKVIITLLQKIATVSLNQSKKKKTDLVLPV